VKMWGWGVMMGGGVAKSIISGEVISSEKNIE